MYIKWILDYIRFNLIIPYSLLQGYRIVLPLSKIPSLAGMGVVKYLFTPLYPLPSREGQFDIVYPAACCREVHWDSASAGDGEVNVSKF
jgi:hypothetical protein